MFAKLPRFAAVLAVTSAFALPAAAEPTSGTYTIDQSHVHATFRVSHLGFSETIGQFKDIAGTITLDAENPANSSVNVTIQTASVDSNWEARDEHLRKADFFNVEEYPEMTFVSTKVEPTGDTTAKVTGDLTLLGVTKPVTLDVTLNGAGPHPFNQKETVGFSATGTIDRTEWGMTYAAPAVGKDVHLYLSAEGALEE